MSIGNMTIKMKTLSNLAAVASALIVVIAFALKMFNLTGIAMSEAVIAGGFIKAVFLPVDASIWIKNSRQNMEAKSSAIVERNDGNNA